ncbi:MAG: hypothetical protein AAF224_08990 [Pseudomonadota bacterium]
MTVRTNKTATRSAIGAAMACTVFPSTAIAGDNAVLDAVDWYKNIYAVSFVENDPDFFSHYADYVFLGFGENVGYQENPNIEAEMSAYIESWVEKGWTNSALQSVEGTAIDSKTVLLTSHWKITSADGESVTKCTMPGWKYIVVDTKAGWRIISEFEAPCMTKN